MSILNIKNFNKKIIDLLIFISNKNNSNFIQLFTSPKFIKNQQKLNKLKVICRKWFLNWYILAYLITSFLLKNGTVKTIKSIVN